MRKIIHLTTVHGRYDVRIFHKQCRSIAAHGYDLTLVVQDGKGNENRDGVKIYDLGNPPGGRIRRILLSPWLAYRFLCSAPADIIHFHDPELLPIGFLLKKRNRRVIYDSHEDYPRYFLSKHWIHPIFRKTISTAFEILENYVTKSLDAVVCATPFITRRFQRINPISIDVNNYPILEEFSPTDKARPFSRTICYIGAISRERGISELLESLVILKDVRLIMCGPFVSKAYESKLRSMAGWKNVDYKGIVGRDEVGRIMSISEIGLVTYLRGPNHNDSQPNKMFEYMSAGLPLIASDFPLWRRIIEETKCGLCVDPSSPLDIARAITSLLSNETLCLAKGSAGRKAIMSRFNWMNEFEKLLNLYEDIK